MTKMLKRNEKSAQESSETVSISNRLMMIKVHRRHAWSKTNKAKNVMLNWAETVNGIQQNEWN